MHSHPDCYGGTPLGWLCCYWPMDWRRRLDSRSSSRRWRPPGCQRPASRWRCLWRWPRRTESLFRGRGEKLVCWSGDRNKLNWTQQISRDLFSFCKVRQVTRFCQVFKNYYNLEKMHDLFKLLHKKIQIFQSLQSDFVSLLDCPFD